MLIDNERLLLVISTNTQYRGLKVCKVVATGSIEYQFEFEMNIFKPCVVVGQKLVVPALDENRKIVLKLYHARAEATHSSQQQQTQRP